MNKDIEHKQKLALTVYGRMMRASEKVGADLHAHLRDHGLTVSQFAVLEALKHKGDLDLSQLALAILKTSGNLTKVVDNLERDGLVMRIRSEQDRRRIMVTLTDKGSELINRAFEVHRTRAAEVFDVLDRDEQEQLSALLRKLYVNRR